MKKGLLLITILMIFLTAVQAEEIMTLQNFVENALERSLSIETELLQYKNAAAARRQSLYSWLPSADLTAAKTYSDYEGESGWNDLSASFSFNWGVTSNDSRIFDMRNQMINMSKSALSLQDTRKNIAYTVLTQYLNVLESIDLVNLQEDILELEDKKFGRIKTMHELGEASILDLQQAEIDKIQAEINLNNLEVSLADRRANLYYYCGLDDNEATLAAVDMVIAEKSPVFHTNLQHRILEKQIASQKNSKKQAAMNLYPWISFNLSYSESSSDLISDFDDYTTSGNVSLSLNYSIFDIFSNLESYKTIRRQYSFYQLQLKDQERSDEIEYQNLQKSFDSQKRNLELYTQKTELAEKNLDQAQIEYEQGMISLLDLNDYQNKLYSARQNQIQIQYQVLETQESINLLISDDVLGKW